MVNLCDVCVNSLDFQRKFVFLFMGFRFCVLLVEAYSSLFVCVLGWIMVGLLVL